MIQSSHNLVRWRVRKGTALSELILSIRIEPLEEGGYLGTSDDLQGLIAQGRTMAETLEIAQDVARKLIKSYLEHGDPLPQKSPLRHHSRSRPVGRRISQANRDQRHL